MWLIYPGTSWTSQPSDLCWLKGQDRRMTDQPACTALDFMCCARLYAIRSACMYSCSMVSAHVMGVLSNLSGPWHELFTNAYWQAAVAHKFQANACVRSAALCKVILMKCHAAASGDVRVPPPCSLRERERERERFTTSIGPARPMGTNPRSCPRLI